MLFSTFRIFYVHMTTFEKNIVEIFFPMRHTLNFSLSSQNMSNVLKRIFEFFFVQLLVFEAQQIFYFTFVVHSGLKRSAPSCPFLWEASSPTPPSGLRLSPLIPTFNYQKSLKDPSSLRMLNTKLTISQKTKKRTKKTRDCKNPILNIAHLFK